MNDFASADESRGQNEVDERTIVNLRASYNVYKNSVVFFNARKLSNNQGHEYGFSDEIGGLYLLGPNLSF